jgi:hypothetical protein
LEFKKRKKESEALFFEGRRVYALRERGVIE